MKINGTPGNTPPGPSSASKPGTAARTNAPAKEGSDVSLSELATRLNSIENSLSEPFDAGRVEALKQAIRDGQFKVNPEVVADKLIHHLRQMLPKGPAE